MSDTHNERRVIVLMLFVSSSVLMFMAPSKSSAGRIVSGELRELLSKTCVAGNVKNVRASPVI
jgi:hypothetical protein